MKIFAIVAIVLSVNIPVVQKAKQWFWLISHRDRIVELESLDGYSKLKKYYALSKTKDSLEKPIWFDSQVSVFHDLKKINNVDTFVIPWPVVRGHEVRASMPFLLRTVFGEDYSQSLDRKRYALPIIHSSGGNELFRDLFGNFNSGITFEIIQEDKYSFSWLISSGPVSVLVFKRISRLDKFHFVRKKQVRVRFKVKQVGDKTWFVDGPMSYFDSTYGWVEINLGRTEPAPLTREQARLILLGVYVEFPS